MPGTPFIEPTSLTVRGIYRIRSRNLLYGVWDGSQFVGIREKLGSRYLFGEAPNTPTSRGTVTDCTLVGMVEEGVSLVERGGTICRVCEDPAEFREWTDEEKVQVRRERGEDYWLGRGRWLCSCDDFRQARPAATENKKLFEILERVEALNGMA